MDVGRVCIKTAGRDAGLTCVVVDVLDNRFVMIDGQTRRKKCNMQHLEPLGKVLKIKKKASHDEVVDAFKKELKLELKEKKAKKVEARPRRKRTVKPKRPAKPKKAAKKEAKTEKKAESKSAPKPAEKK